MSDAPKPPKVTTTFGLNLDFSSETTVEHSCVHTLGFPVSRIGRCAFPAFIKPSVVERLRNDWVARDDDVFLVFPSPPIFDGLVAFSSALVEQRDVDSIDLAMPRWLDGAASRRGWQYTEYLDSLTTRRCLSTTSPPWLFPCSNSGVTLDSPDLSGSLYSSSAAAEGLRIAVFVADPRYLVMKEVQGMRLMGKPYHKDPLDISTCLGHILEAGDFLLEQHNPAVFTGSFGGGSIHNSSAWAEIEACCPDRVRLFFIDDFITNPDVAMGSLARFLNVATLSDATHRAIQESSRLSSIHHYDPAGTSAGLVRDLVKIDAHAELVDSFECAMANAPDLRIAWERHLGRWLHSSNPRLVAWAHGALQREPWNPLRWWALHTARICRPCLFFPRGKCSDDSCAFCHGPGHHKPKRPSKSRRNRRHAYDRTPSPDFR